MTTNPKEAKRPDSAAADPSARTRRTRGAYRRQLAAARPGAPGAPPDAKRAAAAILEVLAGVRTPASAATVLGLRLSRYYLWEQRAIEGLIAACQPRPRGRTVTPDRRLAQLERELAVCRRELARHQVLARTAQRAFGLPAVTVPAPSSASKDQPPSGGARKRRRKPVVRALRAARALRAGDSPGGEVPPAVQEAVEGHLAPGPAGGGSRPAAKESLRSPAQADHGGVSHAGREKTALHH
jgi:hypothetical protein